MDNYDTENKSMNDRLSNAEWIWSKESFDDQYIVIKGSFTVDCDSDVTLDISADTNYMFYLNDELTSFSQSPSYPKHPIVDSISFKAKHGVNSFKIYAYHLGSDGFSSYFAQQAALIFVISKGDEILCASNENTLVAQSNRYLSGLKEKVSPQLGYRLSVDLTKDDDDLVYENASMVDRNDAVPELRRNKKCGLLPPLSPKPIHIGKGRYRYDLSKEMVGYLSLDIESKKERKIKIAYAEHLNDDKMVYLIDNRNFSIDAKLKDGRNRFFEGFLRLGCRYIEVIADDDFDIEPRISLHPYVYPFDKKEWSFADDSVKEIYDIAVYTLECCYHEHYEDCPWREQCLYALDSLNQIDAGLLAFKNLEQIRSSLRLFAVDEREDGLLPICAPSGVSLTIPSFSLFYILAVKSYYDASKDVSFLKESLPRIDRIIAAFKGNMANGLAMTFEGEGKWNFYEWMEGLEGELGKDGRKESDIVINSLFVIALETYDYLKNKVGISSDNSDLINDIRIKLHNRFFDKDKGLYHMSDSNPSYSVLASSLAILSSIAPKDIRLDISKKIMEPGEYGITPTSLSMKRFLYDALLKTNNPSSKEYILNDIKEIMDAQMKEGASCFMETMDGWRAFENAGSLCHGWGTVVICYLYKFGLIYSEKK